ncbi:MAG: glycosyltransferase family 1 protein [Rhizonema sp. PD38]|nr:glycosyltransferase family 1 protein [Rhizonema sp. PD38]
MNNQSNHYFICPMREPLMPIPWDIDDIDNVLDPSCVYFGKIFQVLQKRIKTTNLTFYLTWSLDKLPSYGQHVVVVILGDEMYRIPKYIHAVGAVFKTYSTRPILGCNPFLKPSYKNMMDLLQFLKIWFIRLPGWVSYLIPKLKGFQPSTTSLRPIYDVPLGYYKQSELPIKNIEKRQYDVFFAGSLDTTEYSILSMYYWMKNAKHISRKEMILSLQKIEKKYPEFKIELATALDFGIEVQSTTDKRSYSERLMDTKICLAPRGSVFESFRFFEGLRYGCIVITEALPPRWFYQGAPIIQLNNWNDLDKVLAKLLKDKELLYELHQKSLQWWEEKCSEETVAKYMVEKINSITEM